MTASTPYSLSLDPESESMRHVGQWQPLVSVALVVVTALLSNYNEELENFAFWQKKEGKNPYESTKLYESMRHGS